MRYLILSALVSWSGYAELAPITKGRYLKQVFACPGGANEILSGVDLNNNELLEDSETVVVVIVCDADDYPSVSFNVKKVSCQSDYGCIFETDKYFDLRQTRTKLVTESP